ncbi:MAG: hypothetical protein COU47_03510 [Candidatus Niyogibacteria bacterium CG10_big_fil_rev_8_21_14_0_10_46_36]|uniref:Uncharacterized protein n=1 Tax=Candidatus Niyogibacteria bacterium CG10_big_fil_rev_8_21_14_0_10_46_36 TaxID=1974726 RepID=A0A2H0TCY4_9BACT|nr:MAG: hypothetical protein COU47_03510 [Candidatus Niyogibacteria bacterium CG10_big_fil_rev_8_21_14_0_10_46_36]
MFVPSLLQAFSNIRGVLTADVSIWLLLTPLVVLWVATEFYYGEYKREQFGFSSALTSGMSLVWVSLVAVRVLFLFDREGGIFALFETWILLAFVLYGLFIVYASFTHIVTLRAMGKVAAPSLLYFLSIVAVILGEGTLALNYYILLAFSIVFIVLVAFFFIIKRYFLGLRGDIERVKEAGSKPKM